MPGTRAPTPHASPAPATVLRHVFTTAGDSLFARVRHWSSGRKGLCKVHDAREFPGPIRLSMEYPQHLALPGGHLARGSVLLHGEIPPFKRPISGNLHI